MDKPHKILMLATIAAVVGGIFTIALYLLCDYIVMGSVISENQIQYVQSTTAPPTNYKSNFGVWTVSYDKEKDKYSSTLTVPTAPSTISKYMAGGSGIVLDTDAFEEALKNSSSDVAEQVSYYKESLDDFVSGKPTSALAGYNTSLLAVALYANLSLEGTPLQWENNLDTKDLDKNSEISVKPKGSVNHYFYKCKCGTDFAFAAQGGSGGYYTMTRDQYGALYSHVTECNAFESDRAGFGSVQWTGGRTCGYIKHMWENCISLIDDDDLSLHLAEIKSAERDYICFDLNDKFYASQAPCYNADKSAATLEQLTAYIAGVYECPWYSATFQCPPVGSGDPDTSIKYMVKYNKADRTQEGIIQKSTIRSQYNASSMYSGIGSYDWNFKKYTYEWNNGKPVAESYRVDKALSFYYEIYGDGGE